MNWLRQYGYSDCVFCDIVAHQPWEPATFVYEDEDVAVFHNILGWIPVMLLVVPRGKIAEAENGQGRHPHQEELWRNMGQLGEVAIRMGRAYCQVDGMTQFRLVCNVGSLAMQSQSHAHVHVLGTRFEPHYPDLRSPESLIYEDKLLSAYRGGLPSSMDRIGATAVMVVPREPLTQDEFFARMGDYGPTVVDLARSHVGNSYRLLAEVGPHAPVADNGAHLFILGGGWLGHYV
ncbi:MAG: HIT family protein [Dehalococcoidia bacterium]